MASEQDIIQRESGGNPYVGYTGVDLSGAPRDQYGFPIWEGRMGPAGRSRAAGLYQFEPATWREGAAALGITDFSPQSQKQVYDYTRAKYGEAPWAASATGYSEGTRVGEQRHGGTYLGEIHPEGLSVGGALLLNNLLQQSRQRQEAADKDTGNPLLNSILQQSLSEEPSQPQRQPFDTTALQRATPRPQLPATEPELASSQVPTSAVQPLTVEPPPAPPGSFAAPRPIPGTRDNPFFQPGEDMNPPGAPPVPGSADRNVFSNPNQVAPYNPPGVRDDRQVPISAPGRPVIQPDARRVEAGMLPDIDFSKLKKTGNALLDSILKLVPGEGRPPSDAAVFADKRAADIISGGASAVAQDIGGLLGAGRVEPGQTTPALDRILTGIGVTPPATTDIEQAQQEQQQAQQPPLSIPERITQLGEAVLPYVAGAAPGGGAVTSAGMRGFRGRPSEVPRAEPPPIGERPPERPAEPPPPPPPEPPSGEMPPANPMPPPAGIKAEAQELDDDLFKSAQAAEADRLEAQQLVKRLSDDLKGDADTRAYHERESRMTGKPLPQSETTKKIETLLKPFDDQIHEDATWIRQHAPDIYGEMPEKPLRTAEEGHVHRKVVGMRQVGERLDPGQGDIITGLPGGSLSRRASGMMHRSPDFVLEDNQGNRIWGKGAKVGQKGGPARYGESFVNPNNGVRYTVKEPTTAEITQNTGRKYLDSLIGNTIDNYLRLSRVRRNIEILEKWKPRLQEGGHWIPEGSQTDIPWLWQRGGKVDLPQMRGWADPKIATILNEVYRIDRGDVLGMLEKINKTIIGSLFVLPIRHQLNVAAHYAVGRGFDWVYRNPMLARAYTEVATQGPEYLRQLRAGAGLRYASTLNENFYNTLLSKLFHDQMTDPVWQGIAKELGHSIVDIVKAEYRWSRRALWKVNDVFLTARIMELERAGKPLKEAIRIAEEEIPNYRLPSNSALARKFLQSPLVVFGRYGYGRARALAKTVQNLVGPHATGEERLRALGQAMILTVIGTEGYKLANHALQTMQQQLSGALGPTWGPRIAGDPQQKPLQVSGIGPFGVLRDTAQFAGSQLGPKAAEYVNSALGLNEDQKNWSMLLGSWIQGSPVSSMIGTVLGGGGREPFTGQPVIDPRSTPLGKGIQATEYVLGQIAPLEMALRSMRSGVIPGVGSQFGVTQQYGGPPPRINRMLTHEAQHREARDPLQQFVERLFGGGTPAAAPAPPAPRPPPPPPRPGLPPKPTMWQSATAQDGSRWIWNGAQWMPVNIPAAPRPQPQPAR